MAKFENEGYCPYNFVTEWISKNDNSLFGLWSLIGDSIVYEKKEASVINVENFNKVFSEDIIACDLITSIIKRNANAEKILVRQFYNLFCCTQNISDIPKVLAQVTNPELILHAGSNFAVILADTSYGMDIWVWDLNNCL